MRRLPSIGSGSSSGSGVGLEGHPNHSSTVRARTDLHGASRPAHPFADTDQPEATVDGGRRCAARRRHALAVVANAEYEIVAESDADGSPSGS